jgi:AcrR family transcriptional regulator
MLREAGMSGIGIKDVVARSKTPIGSLYHYFPGGKTQLVAESLQIHADKSRQLLAHFFDGKRSAAAAVRDLFDTAADGFERAGCAKGCALGAVTLDLLPEHGKTRAICSAAFDDWAAIIEPHLPGSSKQARQAHAVLIVSALEGAFIVARAAQSGEPFRAAGKSLAALLRTR